MPFTPFHRVMGVSWENATNSDWVLSDALYFAPTACFSTSLIPWGRYSTNYRMKNLKLQELKYWQSHSEWTRSNGKQTCFNSKVLPSHEAKLLIKGRVPGTVAWERLFLLTCARNTQLPLFIPSSIFFFNFTSTLSLTLLGWRLHKWPWSLY